MFLKFFSLVIVIFACNYALGGEIYQKPKDFLNEVFMDSPPKHKFLWLSKENQQKIKKLIGKKYNSFRVRYWSKNKKTVLILEDIGKYKNITVGFIIAKHKIDEIKILVYRESHGWEIKHPFFTNQFKEVSLQNNKLSKDISSIAGATMSVDALKRMSKTALYLNSIISFKRSVTNGD